MLKWTVSRSLSTTSSSTPHGPIGMSKSGAGRKPFRDLSNTPPPVQPQSQPQPQAEPQPTTTTSSKQQGKQGREHTVPDQSLENIENISTGTRKTPSRRRRYRSQGTDLRSYFQATKPNLRGSKHQQSILRRREEKQRPPNLETFYQSTPRVDTDIELSRFLPSVDSKRSTALTLPTDPSLFMKSRAISKVNNIQSDNELPQNVVNEARANLQSHVSDFFHQISLATSPEDVMEADSVPLSVSVRACSPESGRVTREPAKRIPKTPGRLPIRLGKVVKIHARCSDGGGGGGSVQAPISSRHESHRLQAATPLAGKLSSLAIDQDLPKFENMDNTVTEILSREQEVNFTGKTVAEILLADIEERNRVLGIEEFDNHEDNSVSAARTAVPLEFRCRADNERTAEVEEEEQEQEQEERNQCHDDSSVSSASQLLEDPSPMARRWPFTSPADDEPDDAEFTLRRQRGIRRKRQRRETEKTGETLKRARSSPSQSPSGGPTNPGALSTDFVEAINPNVKKLILETDLDSSIFSEEKTVQAPFFTSSNNITEERGGEEEGQACREEEAANLAENRDNEAETPADEAIIMEEEEEEEEEQGENGGLTREKTVGCWDLESPKLTLSDDCYSSTSHLASVSNTPETPLIATVRRCLKFSPDGEPARPNRRGSIEIEYSVIGERIEVRVIRCKDLRRTNEGPIHAYVKASLKNSNGEGVVRRTAVHRATPNPVFHETLILACPVNNNQPTAKPTSLDIAVWHRDRRARRSELLGCMTLPLPLSQDKEATWHPLETGTGLRTTNTAYVGLLQDCGISPPLSKDGEPDNNNSSAEDLTYLRHLELEPVDPLTGLPLHPGFTARGGRTPCTITRRLIRQTAVNQIPWGFSLSWGRPPRVERVDPGSPAERSGLRPGDHVVFVEMTNVVTRPREEILGLIQAAANQLILEVYRKGSSGTGPASSHSSSIQRPSTMNVSLQQPIGLNSQHAVAFSAEVFPNLAPDAPPEEELSIRETRYWGILKSGHARFMAPLAERRDVLSATDYLILFQNLDELLKISEEIRDEGGGMESYLCRVPRITAAYRRYLSGLQRACCLLVALRRNTAFAKLVCEPAVPHKRRPDLTGVLLLPLEHYREMTRLLGLASPRNCQQARELAQGYREATANASVMEPPRDTGRPLLSLQEVESRLVFARCKPFTLAMPGRQWLFGGALAKVEGRARLQPSWALLLTDMLVFARVSRDRVLFVTEEPLRLSSIAEACFTVRKRPTEFRLQIAINANGTAEEGGQTEVSNIGGCSPHSRPRRRVLVLRAPSPELKAVWHNLLQRQIIYVNTGYGGTPSQDSPEESPITGSNFTAVRESAENLQITRESHRPSDEERESRSGGSIDVILKDSSSKENNHLAQWVENSHRIPPPDQEDGPELEEWTAEELAARAPRENPPEIAREARRQEETITEEAVAEVANSDVEQQSTASSASLSTVKSNSVQPTKKNGSYGSSKENSTGSISICRRCHRSGCPTPPLTRDPFSPLPPKISVMPPTPDLCTKHRLRNGLHESPGRNSPSNTAADGTGTEDGSEDDLDCDGEPPYRALRRFGTMSSLDQDDELEEQPDEDNRETESPPSGFRGWTSRASSYVVSKMVLLEQLGEGVGGYLLQPPAPPERTEFSLDPNDEEGTTSGATSGDDIWGTPTSGGPDDESFTANSPPPNGTAGNSLAGAAGEDNYGLNLSAEDDPDQESENEDCNLPELSMDQLLGNGSLGSLRCFLGRRRLEPLLEEDDSPGSGKHQVGWW